jgi:hypothetical protein
MNSEFLNRRFGRFLLETPVLLFFNPVFPANPVNPDPDSDN